VKFSKKFLFAALFATMVGCFIASPAVAAPLPAGTALFGPSTETDPVGGTVVATLTSPFSAPGAFSGSLTTTVLSGDTSNTLGGLTFIYTLTNDGVSGPNSIGRLSLSDIGSLSLDGSYQVPVAVGTVAPASIDRNPSGDVVGFNFIPVATDPATGFLAPGTSSAVLVLQTNAAAYVQGNYGSLIDGGVATVQTIIPVPEPSAVVLMLVGLAGAAAYVRRS
jgi:hypothetical protein